MIITWRGFGRFFMGVPVKPFRLRNEVKEAALKRLQSKPLSSGTLVIAWPPLSAITLLASEYF